MPNNTLPNHCAFPVSEQDVEDGLTKREYFAAIALQGLLANTELVPSFNPATVAKDAVIYADALIAALNEDPN